MPAKLESFQGRRKQKILILVVVRTKGDKSVRSKGE